MKIRTVDAVAHYGTATKLAQALGCSKSAVSQWGEFVPPLRAYQLQAITNNALPVQQERRKKEARH